MTDVHEIASVRDAYVSALIAGDRRRAFGTVDRAMEAGLDVGTLYIDVLQPALREIGRLWQVSAVTVADEHLATAITQMVMSRVYAQQIAPHPPGGRTLIAACANDERHEVGLRMLCDLIERDGWDTIYLGSSVPLDGLVPMIRERRPDAVALSVSIAPHLSSVREAVGRVRDAMGNTAPYIVVGGRPFLDEPELHAWVGADDTAVDAREAVALITRRFG